MTRRTARTLAAAIAVLPIAAASAGGTATGDTYTIAGPAASINNGSWGWASGGYIAAFRDAIADPANFGPGGTVTTTIETLELGTIDAASLNGADAFASTYWFLNGTQATALREFFLTGGDLIIFNESASQLTTQLGIRYVGGIGGEATGSGFPFEGPFGSPQWVSLYAAGALQESDIDSANGTVLARNGQGRPVVAYWPAGAYAPDAGQLFIASDTELISTFGLADYDAMNFNAMFALNTVAHLSGGLSPQACNPADLNADGVLDLSDINAFIDHFTAGCP